MARWVVIVFFCISLHSVSGQICCSAGTPITGNFNLTALDKGQFSINTTLDVNVVKDLLIGDESLVNDNISRVSTTLIGQLNYSFNKGGVVSLVVPYIWSNEQTTGSSVTNSARASGIGDLALAYFHTIELSNQSLLYLGGAAKLPTGGTQLEDEGIVLQPTLQPGTGSFDFIYTGQYQLVLQNKLSTKFSQLLSFRSNGTTGRYTFHDSYQFGNEFQSITTASSQILLKQTINTPFIAVQYIHQGFHIADGQANSNTGGDWLYLNPGWILALTERINFSLNYVIPIYRSLNGFQLTTSSRIVASAAFVIK